MPRKKKIETEPKIKIFLKCVGRNFKSEGKTFEEAIDKIKISGGAKAVSIITVEKGDYKKERILSASHTSGLFGQGSPTMKAIQLKSVKSLLGV